MSGIAQAHLHPRARRFGRESPKAIAHLGGATLDNEENYLIKKIFAGGLGMVCVQPGPDIHSSTVPGLAPPSPWGATTAQQDLANADCI